MGLRGAVPEDPRERRARGARVQDTVVYGVPARESDRAVWRERAERLEAKGMRLVTARKGTPAELSAGLKLLAAANLLWQRLARIPGIAAGVPSAPESLEDFRRRRAVR